MNVLIPMALTLKVSALATASALILGVALAYALSRASFPGSRLLDAALSLPLVLPPTVMGYYLIVVLGRKGWLGSFLKDWFGISLIFSWQGAVVAAAVASLPLVYKTARAALEGVDETLARAARTLGASEWNLFWRVRLPLSWRGILAGAMLAFARAMGEFGATLMLAGNLPGRTQTLSTAIYSAVQAGRESEANLMVAAASALAMLILYGSGRLLTVRA